MEWHEVVSEACRVLVREGGYMNPDRSVCVERGRKLFYDALMATERKCCDCIVLSFLGWHKCKQNMHVRMV